MNFPFPAETTEETLKFVTHTLTHTHTHTYSLSLSYTHTHTVYRLTDLLLIYKLREIILQVCPRVRQRLSDASVSHLKSRNAASSEAQWSPVK
jgi:hypothetical protein